MSKTRYSRLSKHSSSVVEWYGCLLTQAVSPLETRNIGTVSLLSESKERKLQRWPPWTSSYRIYVARFDVNTQDHR